MRPKVLFLKEEPYTCIGYSLFGNLTSNFSLIIIFKKSSDFFIESLRSTALRKLSLE